jgi:hypothetical protein
MSPLEPNPMDVLVGQNIRVYRLANKHVSASVGQESAGELPAASKIRGRRQPHRCRAAVADRGSGFRVPWIYTLDQDLFVRPARPPNPDSLTLEPWIVEDHWGEEIELERPSALPLDDSAKTELRLFTDAAWTELQAARATPLFETPVVHFLVRAFLADGIDEVMAHMTAIEAALGLEMDHQRKLRPKPDPHPKPSATERVAARIGAALTDAKAVQDYKDLFELRSAFVHGRVGLHKISTPQRVLARNLARRVACALVALASHPARSRANVLADLLDQGIAYL